MQSQLQSQSQQQLQDKYQRKTDKEHILDNPDTYIGSVETIENEMWISTNVSSFIDKSITFNPGLYKLFDEAIVNCRDHVIRMISDSSETKKMVTSISVNVDKETGRITMQNDGNGVDVAKHPEYDIWIPEMIFGHLRTSTNYNKEEKKIVGGKNGFGIKLVFIWSSYGRVETVDHIRGLKYVQEFHRNLDTISPPVITKVPKTAKPYTQISFIPDYTRLNLASPVGGSVTSSSLTDDMFYLFKKRTFDIAANTLNETKTTKKIKVTFNDVPIVIKNFSEYINLYFSADGDNDGDGDVCESETIEEAVSSNADSTPVNTKKISRVYESPNSRWEYAVLISPSKEFQQISFVNGISTFKGGKHVDYILSQILRKLCDYIEKKKKVKVSPNAIKEQLFLFLRCDIENPSFDSQTKDFLNTPSAKFGSSCVVSDNFIEKIAKMGVMEIACSITEAKESKQSKKTDGVKSRMIKGIANFVDANFSGTTKSKECILILCEGLSAMSGIISGLSSQDRNTIGIYPLKGKLLNVRGEQKNKINDNKEVKDIKKILALESGKQYNTIEDVYSNLRYGKVMFLTDSDTDGSHIKGLCINLFHSEWSSLFRINGFLSFMNTPIIKAWAGANKKELFYNQGEYNTWKRGITSPIELKKWNIKYFKGLGTSTSVEFKEYFANKKIVNFVYNQRESDESLDKVFNKKRPDDRKQWIVDYDKEAFLDTSRTDVKYEEFVDNELKHFSVYDCARSIPNVIDGLKISLRKILFCAFKKNLTSEIKVAQFSGYISEKSCYHHGEVSLSGAIVNMAQTFVGSNNINLLEPNGQFGTRLHGGQDSAAERYIFTKLNPAARRIFSEKDDDLLTYLEDDGVSIEPEFFVPTIPFVLVNGITGIGTGFSCTVPPYNPRDIVVYLKNKLENSTNNTAEFVPFYKGFKGTVSRVTEKGEFPEKFLIKGVYEKKGDDTIIIKELPIGTWTMPYITYLESLLDVDEKSSAAALTGAASSQTKKQTPILKSVVNLSTETDIHITVVFNKEDKVSKLGQYITENRITPETIVDDDKLLKLLKLTTNVSTSNMYLFDKDCVLRKYHRVEEIIDYFYEFRLEFYQKQKTHLLRSLETMLSKIENKVRYIKSILDGTLDLRGMTNEQLDEKMEQMQFAQIDDSFDYLIKMPMNSLTKTNVNKLNEEYEKLKNEITIVKNKTIQQMWKGDLDDLSRIYK